MSSRHSNGYSNNQAGWCFPGLMGNLFYAAGNQALGFLPQQYLHNLQQQQAQTHHQNQPAHRSHHPYSKGGPNHGGGSLGGRNSSFNSHNRATSSSSNNTSSYSGERGESKGPGYGHHNSHHNHHSSRNNRYNNSNNAGLGPLGPLQQHHNNNHHHHSGSIPPFHMGGGSGKYFGMDSATSQSKNGNQHYGGGMNNHKNHTIGPQSHQYGMQPPLRAPAPTQSQPQGGLWGMDSIKLDNEGLSSPLSHQSISSMVAAAAASFLQQQGLHHSRSGGTSAFNKPDAHVPSCPNASIGSAFHSHSPLLGNSVADPVTPTSSRHRSPNLDLGFEKPRAENSQKGDVESKIETGDSKEQVGNRGKANKICDNDCSTFHLVAGHENNSAETVPKANKCDSTDVKTVPPSQTSASPTSGSTVKAKPAGGNVSPVEEKYRNGTITDAGMDAAYAELCEASSGGQVGPPVSLQLSYQETNSAKIWQFYMENRQTDLMYHRKIQLRNALHMVMSYVFENAGLFVVGSSMNGFGTDKSDMDLCLTITARELHQKKEAFIVLNQLVQPLRKCSFIRNLQLIRAKVPILKFRDTLAGVDCDLNINNVVGIYNTHLLAMYTRIDWRVRPLAMFAKHWAQCLDIHDASRGRLSTYTIILMMIHYLQAGCSPPVLPSLQMRFPKFFNYERPVKDIDMRLELPWEELRSANTSSLAELFQGFIEFFAEQFDFSGFAVSVRQGLPMPMDVAIKQLPPHEQLLAANSCKMFIEEPFSLTNAARSLFDDSVFARIERAFRTTLRHLRQQKDLNTVLTNPV